MSRKQLPPGALQANWFSLFNAVSWQITLGSPVVLYAKGLGASSTVLGIIASLTPLLVVLQIPAAHLLPKYGYRKFILAGWSSRTVCIFGLAVVPVLWFLDPHSKLSLVLLVLFIFNLLRGMASGAWLPWMSQIIPEEMRGRFLSRDQMFGQVGCMLALVMASLTLASTPTAWQFSLVFLFSALGATASLYFIRKVPDVTAPEQLRVSGTRVPWEKIVAYPPFLRLTVYNLIYVVAVGGVGVFAVAFLRSEAGYTERRIIALSILAVVGAIASLPWTARMLDRTGSRWVMVSCVMAFVAVLMGWFCLASRAISAHSLLIAGLFLVSGVAGVNIQVANNRLAMGVMPKMGRNHFFAIYTVITNMAAGLSPIVWGMVLDGVGGWTRDAAGVNWNRYSLFFAMAAVAAAAAAVAATRLIESAQVFALEAEVGVTVSAHATGSSPIAAGGTPVSAHIPPRTHEL